MQFVFPGSGLCLQLPSDLPAVRLTDENGKTVEITVIAGMVNETKALPPAPDSWAADTENQVAIFTVKMEPGARWSLPPVPPGTNRSLYFHRGDRLTVNDTVIPAKYSFDLNTEDEIREAIRDYRATEFGGWPWPTHEHVFPRDKGRFARYLGGKDEIKM